MLTLEGTRVIVLKDASGKHGVVEQTRQEPYLKSYVVRCDDGTLLFASPCDLAREDDPAAAPLGEPLLRD